MLKTLSSSINEFQDKLHTTNPTDIIWVLQIPAQQLKDPSFHLSRYMKQTYLGLFWQSYEQHSLSTVFQMD